MTSDMFRTALAVLAIAAMSATPIVATEAMGCGCCGGQMPDAKAQSGCMAGDGKANKTGMSCMKKMNMSDVDTMSIAQKTSDDAMMSGMDHSKMDMAESDAASSPENADVAFAKAMIPHHETAVQMAKQLLKNGKNDEMKSLASESIAAQNKEIRTLYGWLAKNAE